MSLKHSVTTSNYLEWDSVFNKSMKLLKTDEKKFKIAFLSIVGINMGLRISDILKLKHQDLKSDNIILSEQKTKKRREIRINDNVKAAYKIYRERLGIVSDDDFLFKSQKGVVFSVRHVNRLLKEVFGTKSKNISSHSLRKTFGRRIWENDNYSERSLILLSKLFNHTSPAITRIYLGIQQEELDNIYLSL
ncbi:MAG: tyrosine-type recombinase/integrase [Carboxylicivirga sp.]|jgi:integrase|nr:tyrosine-type recombinase/integrase [Carboxylicivirga sp.]